MLEQSLELGPNAIERKVFPLLGEQIDFYWPQIAEGLKDCPGFYELYTTEWTYTMLKTGRLQVWALSDGAIRGIIITQILEFPRKRVFEILALYGLDMLTFFREMNDVLDWFAAQNSCTAISARCRPGLQRALKGFGCETTHYIMSRAVQTKRSQ